MVKNSAGVHLEGVRINGSNNLNRRVQSDNPEGVTSADGTFSIFCTELSPYSVSITPPSGLCYLAMRKSNLIIDTTNEETYILSTAVYLSGQVSIPSGLGRLPYFRIASYEMSTDSLSGYARMGGSYRFLGVPLSTAVRITTSFNYDGGSGNTSIVDLTVTSDSVQNLMIPGGMWNSSVVNVDGAPVGLVAIRATSITNTNVQCNNLDFTKSADGTFSVFCMELNPYSMTLTPPSESTYVERTINEMTIAMTKQKTYVLFTGNPSASPTVKPSVSLIFIHA